MTEGRNADDLDFVIDGAQRLRGALPPPDLRELEEATAPLPADRAGVRLRDAAAFGLRAPIAAAARSVLGPGAHPVRAVLFDKTPDTNWALGWHQDRTIAVKERIDVPGFGPWTVKDGILHVAPPYDILASLATLRIHMDPVGADNAPLMIAPGSHRLGRIAEVDIPGVVRHCGSVACLAEPGDIWLYATPILHASAAAAAPHRRRVLQVDFAPGGLPGGLQWAAS